MNSTWKMVLSVGITCAIMFTYFYHLNARIDSLEKECAAAGGLMVHTNLGYMCADLSLINLRKAK